MDEIEQIPMAEIMADREASETDIVVCQLALDEAIDAEIQRRKEFQ